MRSDITKYLKVVQIQKPVCVVNKKSLSFGEIDETGHLLFEALNIVSDGFGRHHFSHVGFSGWVTNHSGTATNQSDWLVACHLETLHKAKGHEVAYMKAVSGWVETDVEGCLSVVDEIGYKRLVGYLGNQPTCF